MIQDASGRSVAGGLHDGEKGYNRITIRRTKERVMQVNITGHHVELTDPLRDYVNEKLIRVERHYDNITNVQVTLSVEKARQLAACTLHAAGAELHAEAQDSDMYAAIDALADKLDRQLVKHKEKSLARAQGAGAR
jgi:putative sigma-54 modulation protein